MNGHGGKDPIAIDARVGQTITLDASESRDPDGQKLHFSWFHYPEAGAAGNNLAGVKIDNAEQAIARVTATEVCRPRWFVRGPACEGPGVAHIILALTDDGSPRLTSYRRVILTVHVNWHNPEGW